MPMEIGRKGTAGNDGASHVWKGEVAYASSRIKKSTSFRGAFPFNEVLISE